MNLPTFQWQESDRQLNEELYKFPEIKDEKIFSLNFLINKFYENSTELSNGFPVNYETKSLVSSKRGAVPQIITGVETMYVPPAEIASYPTLRFSDLKNFYNNDFNLAFPNMIREFSIGMQNNQDNIFFNLINYINNLNNTTQINDIEYKFDNLYQLKYKPKNILLHKDNLNKLEKKHCNFDSLSDANKKWINGECNLGLIGTYKSYDVYIHDIANKDYINILAEPEFTGAVVLNKKYHFAWANVPERLRFGFVGYKNYNCGIFDINTVQSLKI